MRCVPRYTVSYRGRFFGAGVEFEIAAEDAEMMRAHGTVSEDNPSVVTIRQTENPAVEEKGRTTHSAPEDKGTGRNARTRTGRKPVQKGV